MLVNDAKPNENERKKQTVQLQVKKPTPAIHKQYFIYLNPLCVSWIENKLKNIPCFFFVSFKYWLSSTVMKTIEC